MVYRIPEAFERGSVFSDDRKYRYSLYRKWDERPMVLFLMLNPSIADNEKNDPTQNRCQGFAQRLGYGGYWVGNVFAYVSTDPMMLLRAKDPVGIENDAALEQLHKESSKTIVAWGCQKKNKALSDLVHARALKVLYVLTGIKEVYALATCVDKCPRHPLYLQQDLNPSLYRSRR